MSLTLRTALLALLLAPIASAAGLQSLLSRAASGVVQLPPGNFTIDRPLQLPSPSRNLTIEGHPSGTFISASPDFRGEALLIVHRARHVRIRRLAFDGARGTLETRQGLPPYHLPFVRFTRNNGILAEDVESLSIAECRFRNIPGFAVLVARARFLSLTALTIEASGSRNEKGRNNTTGGILIEEGSTNFRVEHCILRDVRGNGIWTHSLYTSPRNGPGRIAYNRFSNIGRDAIQVGHASGVRVEHNSGERIGYPNDEVDVENGGTPVAIDTAGNVDLSNYSWNRFSEINGKCIDLDGFHHGAVHGNVCRNLGKPEDYPFGHFGIVFNNTNPDMQSRAISVTANEINGTKFGGIFVIGREHLIRGNRLLRLNTAGCNESHARFGCIYNAAEPDILRTGIYLGRQAERPDPALDNVIEDNVIQGHDMSRNCLGVAPGIELSRQRVARNVCRDNTNP